MTKILFIGNFLTKKFNSLPISEQIAKNLSFEGYECEMCSRQSNQIIRLLDIFTKVMFGSYSIVHIDVFSGKAFYFASLASFLGKIRGKKIILTLHGGKLPEFHSLKKKMVEKTLKRSTVLQSPSMYLKSYFKTHSIHVEYCPNPVDLKNFQYQEPLTGNHKVLWVRAFTEIYNPIVAVDAIKALKFKFPNVTLTMIGPDKGLLNETKNKIQELGLTDQIVIIGSVPNNELQKFYHSHSIFINTTSFESFGVAVAEAAACGIPIVTNPVGEIPYLYENEKDMLFVKEMNGKGFAQSIERLLSDEALFISLSENAFLKAKQFTWENVRNHWLKSLDN
jgi:glycosyltransferase involved in cell wall biosynthesis